MFKSTGFDNSALLLELVDLLKHGKPIPSELAEPSSEVIRVAVTQGGKLDLGKRPGRSSAKKDQMERAMTVGHIMGSHNMGRREAIQKLSEKTGKKISTITKDCQHYAKILDIHRRGAVEAPKYKRLYAEFRKLLRTFTHEDGSGFSERDVDEVCESVPASRIRIYVTRIRNGPVRRDETFLETVLSDK